MDNNIQMEEDVVRFLEGDMNEEEVRIFKSRLDSDPQLQKLLLEYKTIMVGIEYWGDEQVRASITKVHKDLEEKNFFKNGKSVSEGGQIWWEFNLHEWF
jgi:flavodoxin